MVYKMQKLVYLLLLLIYTLPSLSATSSGVSLDDAIATTSYIYKGVRYERSVFASLADRVIIVRLTADKKRALSFGIRFESQLPSQVFTVSSHEGIKGSMNELAAVVDGVDQEGIKGGLIWPQAGA